jgi:hypothetical protein
MTERCTAHDDDGKGCVRQAGHTGKHKMRDNPDAVFAGTDSGKRPAKKLGPALKARKEQFLKAADEVAGHLVAEEKSDRIAALCEIATAMGMTRVQMGEQLAWVNPQTGAAAMMDLNANSLRPATILATDGDTEAPLVPCSLMNILGVQGLTLPDGGTLYACGGRMIVQTPSGGLRPATLNIDPALGPGGDGEGR